MGCATAPCCFRSCFRLSWMWSNPAHVFSQFVQEVLAQSGKQVAQCEGIVLALSEFEKKRIEKIFTDYCENKVPPHVRDQIRVEFQIRGDDVKLFESRPPWRGGGDWIPSKIARFKKDHKTETWFLYWADRNGKWREYPPLPFHAKIEKLLAEVEKNESGAFWG